MIVQGQSVCTYHGVCAGGLASPAQGIGIAWNLRPKVGRTNAGVCPALVRVQVCSDYIRVLRRPRNNALYLGLGRRTMPVNGTLLKKSPMRTLVNLPLADCCCQRQLVKKCFYFLGPVHDRHHSKAGVGPRLLFCTTVNSRRVQSICT